MSVVNNAIELPVKRQSRSFETPFPDVHDPNYIPVLDGVTVRANFTTPLFSALPSVPTLYMDQAQPQTALTRTKSASAPERVVQDHDAHPVPSCTSATSQHIILHEIESSHTITHENDIPSSSEDTITMSSEPSTDDTTSTLVEQVYTIPGNAAPKLEEIRFPAVPVSARSSMSSMRKSTVPTSRYNKKPLPSIPSIPLAALSIGTPTSRASMRSIPEPAQPPSVVHSPGQVPAWLSIENLPIRPTPPRSRTVKSTASERRNRALHSNPSSTSPNPQFQSQSKSQHQPQSQPQPQPQTPSIPTEQGEFSKPTTRSRSHSIVNSQQPFPAPTTPLPSLPSHAKRPSTRDKDRPTANLKPKPTATSVLHIATQSLSAPTPLEPPISTQKNDHTEMAAFMTTNKTTIFRRFDDIHVRLLLHLQDEISGLEKQLLDSDLDRDPDPDSGLECEGGDRIGAKANVMRELRKAMGEYDHLFTTWTAMQASPANDKDKRDLATWLQNHPSNPNSTPSLNSYSAGPGLGIDNNPKVSHNANQDLTWLTQNSKDLSCVSIENITEEEEKKAVGASVEAVNTNAKSDMNGVEKGRVSSSSSASTGGFWGLFSCASKRK